MESEFYIQIQESWRAINEEQMRRVIQVIGRIQAVRDGGPTVKDRKNNVVHLGQNPQLRYAPNGNPVCTLSAATDESYTAKETGERNKAVKWHRNDRLELGTQQLSNQGHDAAQRISASNYVHATTPLPRHVQDSMSSESKFRANTRFWVWRLRSENLARTEAKQEIRFCRKEVDMREVC
jgi:hypothetical protein